MVSTNFAHNFLAKKIRLRKRRVSTRKRARTEFNNFLVFALGAGKAARLHGVVKRAFQNLFAKTPLVENLVNFF